MDSAEPAKINTSRSTARGTRPRPGWRPSRGEWCAWTALASLFVLGLLLPLLKGDRSLAGLWAANFGGLVVGCSLVRGAWRAAVTWSLLDQRGMTTLATYVGFAPGADENSPGQRVYEFTDTDGERHQVHRTGFPAGRDEIAITYDPARPDAEARTSILLARLLGGVPVALVVAWYLLWYFTAALHA